MRRSSEVSNEASQLQCAASSAKKESAAGLRQRGVKLRTLRAPRNAEEAEALHHVQLYNKRLLLSRELEVISKDFSASLGAGNFWSSSTPPGALVLTKPRSECTSGYMLDLYARI